MSAASLDTHDLLIAEYQTWCEAHGLPSNISADEHERESLTDEQSDWLYDFCERWDAAFAKVQS